MALIHMSIQTVVSGNGPLASLVVLTPTHADDTQASTLPIRIGNVEAAAISMGIGDRSSTRPLTHDLLAATIMQLGAKLNGVAIVGASGTTFFAQLMLTADDGSQVMVDSRPSDAIALAVRMHAPIFADESVLSSAAMPNFKLVENDANSIAMEQFHSFVERISPSDFE